TATPLSLPGQRTGTVRFGDAAEYEFTYSNGPKDKIEDFFKFTVPDGPPTQVDISLTFPDSEADLDLFLFRVENNSLTALAVSNGNTTTETIAPVITLGPGTYLVGVSAFDRPDNTAQGNYTLTVTPGTAPPAPVITSLNPVSAIAGSDPLSITVNGKYFLNG